jgi:anaphase-promoting complex subunit 11
MAWRFCIVGRKFGTDQAQHCIFSWLRQESAQDKCPMCRQRMTEFKLSEIEAGATGAETQETNPDTSPMS